MLMSETEYPEGTPISGYARGTFGIAGHSHEGALLIMPGQMGLWTPSAPMVPDDFSAVLEARAQIDVLLIGMGPDIGVLPRPVIEVLDAVSLGFDVMATSAACRTYNVLLAENRRVAAALLPI